MSIIGTRPPLISETNLYELHHRARLAIKPGITGIYITFFAVWGVINLLEGYGNDNPGAKSQGIKQLMAGGGVVLIGTQLVPLLSGLFS